MVVVVVVSPPGGSISTGTEPTPQDPVVSTFSLPATGPGAVITLDEDPCGPFCNGQIVFLSPFVGYEDVHNPPLLRITWDASLAVGAREPIFVLKEGSSDYVQVPLCSRRPYASPCIVNDVLEPDGDRAATIRILSGDPRFLR